MISQIIAWIKTLHFHDWEAIEEQRGSAGWRATRFQCTKCTATTLNIDTGW